jgi:putative NADH-flavin reductase
MRIVVFGASGHCGSHFLRLAAQQGHDLTAAIRPSASHYRHERVATAKGDVLDPAFARAVIPGHDGVISTLGMRYRHPWSRRESPDDFCARAIGNIVDAMTRSHVHRISMMSAAGVGDSRPGLNVVMRILLATSNVGYAYADLDATETILRSSPLDWQAVRPTTLSNRRGTGRICVAARYALTASIPREDVAAFMLRQVEADTFIARTPIIRAC